MTTTNTNTDRPSLAIALPVTALHTIRVRELVIAALYRLRYAEARQYWASPEGKRRSEAMWCGEQDAVSARLEGYLEVARSHEEVADTITSTIAGNGLQQIMASYDGDLMQQALADAMWIREFCDEDLPKAWIDRARDVLTRYLTEIR